MRVGDGGLGEPVSKSHWRLCHLEYSSGNLGIDIQPRDKESEKRCIHVSGLDYHFPLIPPAIHKS